MKSEPVVRVEGLGKRYHVPGAGPAKPVSGSPLAVALKQRFPALRNAEEKHWFWALRDACFELQRGEVLGIIGRNGAGKSTLLKLLSGIVAPTEGTASLVGRVGSLLEVGTGFHPDLSGRDNVVLSAALLGVSRAEVLAEMDSIIEYAGIGDFIDVPVKRYSSGMYMRLAYSVTALLRSDILLLDEVLAVGDAEFQRKTKRNVDTIAHDGRTVLFVSHSMASVTSLCTRCIWLERGQIVADGPPEEITEEYLKAVHRAASPTLPADIADAPPFVDLSAHQGYHVMVRDYPLIRSIETCRGDGTPARVFNAGETMRIRIRVEQQGPPVDYLAVAFHTMDDRRVTAAFSHGASGLTVTPSSGTVECVIPELTMVGGDYALIVEAGTLSESGDIGLRDSVSDATQVRIALGTFLNYPGLVPNQGHIAQRTRWENLPRG